MIHLVTHKRVHIFALAAQRIQHKVLQSGIPGLIVRPYIVCKFMHTYCEICVPDRVQVYMDSVGVPVVCSVYIAARVAGFSHIECVVRDCGNAVLPAKRIEHIQLRLLIS